ncbi:MAG TPA: carboxymuconolactone decarboxylase family protein [Pseudonocardiaceae bacterium]|jgi:4-carboxymuconolactone decarboxylase|nr:carboxymuconolactone decarboxylase family protein [Pseudonocardiaceae bacterium]
MRTWVAFWFSERALHRLAGSPDRPDRMIEPLRKYAHLPGLLRGYAGLERATAATHTLDRRHRALAELNAALAVRCAYCIDLGSEVARRWGLTDDELLALGEYRTSPLFGPVDRLVLAYAEGMSQTPVAVAAELRERLREHFTDAQVVELTHIVALENLRGRFNLALDIEAAGFSAGRVCAVPMSGRPA